MKIPGPRSPGTFFDDQSIPDGACGTVLEGEGDLTYWDHLMVPYTDYGCYIDFPSHPSMTKRGWFVNRPRLLKITPNDDMKNEDDLTAEEKKLMYELVKAITEINP